MWTAAHDDSATYGLCAAGSRPSALFRFPKLLKCRILVLIQVLYGMWLQRCALSGGAAGPGWVWDVDAREARYLLTYHARVGMRACCTAAVVAAWRLDLLWKGDQIPCEFRG